MQLRLGYSLQFHSAMASEESTVREATGADSREELRSLIRQIMVQEREKRPESGEDSGESVIARTGARPKACGAGGMATARLR